MQIWNPRKWLTLQCTVYTVQENVVFSLEDLICIESNSMGPQAQAETVLYFDPI